MFDTGFIICEYICFMVLSQSTFCLVILSGQMKVTLETSKFYDKKER